MKKEKLIYTIPIFIFLLFGAVQMADAAITWVKPVDGGTIAGATQFFNLSVGSANNASNCSIQIYSASTANSSATTLFLVKALPLTNLTLNGTYSTKGLEDSNDYSILATCYNATGTATTLSTITVKVDNSVPIAPTSGSIASNTRIKDKENSTLTFTMTVAGNQTTGCTLYLGGNSGGPYTQYATTHSANTCTYVWTAEQGSWEYYMKATDGTNTTNSAITGNIDVVQGISPGGVTAIVVASGGEIQDAGGAAGTKEPAKGLNMTAVLLILAAGVVLWKFVLTKKKK